MTKSRVIRVFSFIMALTLVFAMYSAPSYAISPEAFGTWILNAAQAIEITSESTVAQGLQFGNDIRNFFSSPYKFVDNQFQTIPYTFPPEDLQQYLDRSTITFKGDEVIIDGKHYQDVWLSNEAAEKFRVNAFDIKSAFNIASNSNGIYVSGAGYFEGIPIFNVNNIYRSQNYSHNWGTYSIGNTTISSSYVGSVLPNYPRFVWYINGTDYQGSDSAKTYGSFTSYVTIRNPSYTSQSGTLHISFLTDSDKEKTTTMSGTGNYISQPFNFDWVSGNIPADEVLPSNYGLHIFVPTQPSEWEDTNIIGVINQYNTYILENPDIQTDVDLQLSNEEISAKIDAILALLAPISVNLNPEFGPLNISPVPPTPTPSPTPIPTPSPDPSNPTIGQQNWNSLYDLLTVIINRLENIYDLLSNNFQECCHGIQHKIDEIKDEIINLGDKIEQNLLDLGNRIENSLVDLGNKFELNLGGITLKLQPIIDGINVLIDGVDNIINNFNDLVNDIITGDTNFFGDIVDSIKQPFLPILDLFKQRVHIWHYVVEWYQNISAPFAFFWNVLGNINPVLRTPFYAVAAASLVIAIYRRFMQ